MRPPWRRAPWPTPATPLPGKSQALQAPGRGIPGLPGAAEGQLRRRAAGRSWEGLWVRLSETAIFFAQEGRRCQNNDFCRFDDFDDLDRYQESEFVGNQKNIRPKIFCPKKCQAQFLFGQKRLGLIFFWQNVLGLTFFWLPTNSLF